MIRDRAAAIVRRCLDIHRWSRWRAVPSYHATPHALRGSRAAHEPAGGLYGRAPLGTKTARLPAETLQRKKQETTYGPFSPTGAVRAVMEGIKVLYLGGWATSAKGSESEDPGANLANYYLDRVPKEGGSWVRALLHQDEVQRSTRIRMTSAQTKNIRLFHSIRR